MGNKQTKVHLENASKTGVCTLANCKLEELPSDLFKLVNLRSLDISANKLSRYPPELQLLKNLKVLNVSNNRLTEINVSKLTKLESIICRSNLILQFPNVSLCRNLKTIDLSDNKLKSFPPGLSGLEQLSLVDLRKNQISNVDGIKDLKCIEINLNQNQLARLPDSIISCTRLKVLRIEENCLSEISSEILKNSTISTFYFDGNLFDKKKIENTEGYEEYSKRYTQSKQKAE